MTDSKFKESQKLMPDPLNQQPWYRRTYGYSPGKCPNAEEFYARALSLPLYPSISDADAEKVVASVKNLAKQS